MSKSKGKLIPEGAPVPKFKEDRSHIPKAAARYPYEDDPESKKYIISFKFYNDSESQIEVLNQSNGRKILKNLRIMGSCRNRNELKANNIKVKPISNSGEYNALFNRLPPDADLFEDKVSLKGRIFYFFEGSNQINIVTFRQNHYETNKHR